MVANYMNRNMLLKPKQKEVKNLNVRVEMWWHKPHQYGYIGTSSYSLIAYLHCLCFVVL